MKRIFLYLRHNALSWLASMPLAVTVVQVLVLDFPDTMWFYASKTYSPWPQVLYPPLVIGIILVLYFVNADYFFHWVIKTVENPTRVRTITFFISASQMIVFWLCLMYAQRMVIMEYLNAINANGLHSLRLIIFPWLPEVFVDNGMGWLIVLVIYVLGIVGIVMIRNNYKGLLKVNYPDENDGI